MNVNEIIKKYLRENGYDGLCNEKCGCGIDNLMPCDTFACQSCVPASKHIATEEDAEKYDCGIGDTIYTDYFRKGAAAVL